MNPQDKNIVIILQCAIVKERCGGYFCERALTHREGAFSNYPADKHYRHINLTCGGCCGRASLRKISNYLHQLKKKEGIERDRAVVHLSTCMTKPSYHGPKCPHLDYIKELLSRLEMDIVEDTKIGGKAQRKRDEGIYK